MRRDIPVWRIGGDIRDAEKRDDLRGVDDGRFGCALIAAPAAAQEARGSVVEAPLPPANADDDANPQPETPLTPEEAAALGNALTFGAADLADAKPAKPLRLPGLDDPDKFRRHAPNPTVPPR